MDYAMLQDQGTPIYIFVDEFGPEALPWEALCNSAGNFLALDTRWPVARIAGNQSTVPIDRAFSVPFKVMAVLSAAGVSAQQQWKAFYTPFKTSPVPLALKVLVSEEKLFRAVKRLRDNRIDLDYLAQKSQLLETIKAFNPHVLHFFCHGSMTGGGHLELATRSDWARDSNVGSIAIEPLDFRQVAVMGTDIFVVTLNCCQGAAPLDDVRSLALSLVYQGFPAVIGMREAIASDDAHTFSEALYPALMGEIEGCVAGGADLTSDTWVKTLHKPRNRLAEGHSHGQTLSAAAANCKQWTLPVVYVRPEAFSLKSRRQKPELTDEEKNKLLGQLYTLLNFRAPAARDPNTPITLLNELDQQIASVEGQLYLG
jgi:hypothetical protein